MANRLSRTEAQNETHARFGWSLADVFVSPHPYSREPVHWLGGNYSIVMATPHQLLVRVKNGAVRKFQDDLEKKAKESGMEYPEDRPFQSYHYGQHVAVHFDHARIGSALIDRVKQLSSSGIIDVRDQPEPNLPYLNPFHRELDFAFGPSKKMPWDRAKKHVQMLERAIALNQAAIRWIQDNRENIEQGKKSPESQELAGKMEVHETAKTADGMAHGWGGVHSGLAWLGAGIYAEPFLGLCTVGFLAGSKMYKIWKEKEVERLLRRGIHGEIALTNYFTGKPTWYEKKARGETMDPMEKRALINETIGMLRATNKEHAQTIDELKSKMQKSGKK